MSSLQDDIMKTLTEYTEEIGVNVNKAGRTLSKKAQKMLKATSPRSKLTGVKHYGDSWSIKNFGKRGTFRIVIHESTDKYRLTHLLENGFTHVPDNGKIKPQKHIEPAQDWLNREFEKAVERIINDM